MCRFVAYLGKEPLILSELLLKPENSLVQQSRHAKQALTDVNADGFGIGWYNHEIDGMPGMYKSIQPAWNDYNLKHIIRQLRSTCFVGHVRHSTVGDVTTFNCHPFSYKNYLFVHNGTIHRFNAIKRELRRTLADESFDLIKGNTDTEHFFALLMDTFIQDLSTGSLDEMVSAMLDVINSIATFKIEAGTEDLTRLNTVFTDGKKLIATRYISESIESALSLHYCEKKSGGVIIASEPLTDYADEWQEVPSNHLLLVDESLTVSLRAI
jgi:glutamine amidotransferase